MAWVELKSQEDIDCLMSSFNCFHDSCIKECHYVTGMYVDENKSMGCDDQSSSIRLVVQSQRYDPIEIYFEDIKEANIHTNNKYFNMISDAAFCIKEDYIYWANTADWNENDSNKEITYIICKKVSYRNI